MQVYNEKEQVSAEIQNVHFGGEKGTLTSLMLQTRLVLEEAAIVSIFAPLGET